MKKYLSLGLATVFLLVLLSYLPAMVQGVLPKVFLLKLASVSYQSEVNASGTIAEKSKQEVSASVPFVPGTVYKEVGDSVKAGDLIATVDREATKTALLSLSGEDAVSKEALASLISGEEPNGSETEKTSAIPEQIIATADGVITAMNLSPGTLWEGGSAATISQSDQLVAKLSVNESSVSGVQTGQSVTLTGSGFGDQSYQGTVTKISPTARKQMTGTVQETVVDVSVQIENPDDRIKPGFSVQAKIATSQPRMMWVLPYEAVSQEDDGTEYVYVYEQGRAVKRQVLTGLETARGIEICGGLTPQDWVIADSAAISSSGRYVSVQGIESNQEQ